MFSCVWDDHVLFPLRCNDMWVCRCCGNLLLLKPSPHASRFCILLAPRFQKVLLFVRGRQGPVVFLSCDSVSCFCAVWCWPDRASWRASLLLYLSKKKNCEFLQKILEMCQIYVSEYTDEAIWDGAFLREKPLNYLFNLFPSCRSIKIFCVFRESVCILCDSLGLFVPFHLKYLIWA